MGLNSGIDRSLVKDAVPDKAINSAINLSQQLWNLRRILLLAFRHGGGDNSTLGIHPDVQFFPASGPLLAMFLAMPFTLTADL
jgi:hypothetical protein